MTVLAALLMALVVAGCAEETATQPEPTASPSPVVQPSQTPISGWQRFEGRGYELWLPGSYVGGDFADGDVQLAIAELRKQGPEFEQFAEYAERNPDAFIFYAVDTEGVGPSGGVTNVNVTKAALPSAMPMKTVLRSMSEALPSQLTVVRADVVRVDSREAGRLVIEMDAYGLTLREVMYLFKGGSTLWMATYATEKSQFGKLSPVFEKSAGSFRATAE